MYKINATNMHQMSVNMELTSSQVNNLTAELKKKKRAANERDVSWDKERENWQK